MRSKVSRQVDQELELLKVSISKLKQTDFLTEMVLQNQGGFDLTSHEIKKTAFSFERTRLFYAN